MSDVILSAARRAESKDLRFSFQVVVRASRRSEILQLAPLAQDDKGGTLSQSSHRTSAERESRTFTGTLHLGANEGVVLG
ncbi:MAG: hypothetical protein AAFP15_16800, partial [Bacteroidota bacterium]